MSITFDPSTLLDVVLSGGNLTGTNNNTVNPMGCKGAAGDAKSTGKLYFEMTGLQSNNGTQNCVAVAKQSWAYTDIVQNAGSGTGSAILFQGSQGVVYANGSFTGDRIIPSGNIVATDIIAIAVDLVNQQFWAKDLTNGAPWLNNSLADPASNAHGVGFSDNPVVPWFGWGGTVTGDNAMTINLRGPFTGAIPSGFTAWDTSAIPYNQARVIG